MAAPVRNIIVDVDGTILDSKRDIAGAQLWVLRQLGVDAYSEPDLYPHIGKTLQETFTELLPAGLHDQIPRAAVMYRDYYRPRALDHTTLFPGVAETLALLRERGIGLAAATTKSSETTARVLGHFGIAGYFDQLQGTDNMPYKPEPFIINKILAERRWERGSTVMVGDTDKDILAGKSAGLRTAGVTYGSFSATAMAALRPDFILDAFPNILDILS